MPPADGRADGPAQGHHGPALVRVDVADTAAMRGWTATAATAFLQPAATDRDVRQRQERLVGQRLWAAVDEGRTVATFRSFDSDLALPGRPEPLPVNAISSVAVAPTHRRRGLLSRWMRQEADRAARAGVPASILIASEGGIYSRFGFGPATRACTWTVDTARARFLRPTTGRVDLVDGAAVCEHAPAVYAAARGRGPGTIARPAERWRQVAQTVPATDTDPRRRFALRTGPDGTVDGLVVFSLHDQGPDGGQGHRYGDRVAEGTVVVTDLWAGTDEAYDDLWQFCLGIDLVRRVVAVDRSPTEPLPLLLADPRAARDGAVSDFLWLRVHDVEAVLSARRYPVPGELDLQVVDPSQAVAGRYRLQVGQDGTGWCEQVRDDLPSRPDATLGPAALASLVLGSGQVGALARSGGLVPRDHAALARLDALLGWPDEAWCGTWF